MTGAVTVDPQLPGLEEKEVTRAYWCGTLPNSPRQNVVLGGVTFCKGMGPTDEQGRLHGPPGSIVHLTAGALQRVKDAVMDRVVHVSGARRSVVTRAARTFRTQPGDVPLAKYLYMIDVEEAASVDPIGWRAALPTPMWSPAREALAAEVPEYDDDPDFGSGAPPFEDGDKDGPDADLKE